MSCEDAGWHGAHPQLAHTEEARGSNPLTSTPETSRSERRQRRAGGAHCMLRPHHGRTRKSQSSPGGSQRPGDSALGLTWKQPRAVDAGKRGLGQPARHNASAATGAARGCGGPDNHRERLPISSGVRAGLSERVAGVQLCALFLFACGHLDGGSFPDPALSGWSTTPSGSTWSNEATRRARSSGSTSSTPTATSKAATRAAGASSTI